MIEQLARLVTYWVSWTGPCCGHLRGVCRGECRAAEDTTASTRGPRVLQEWGPVSVWWAADHWHWPQAPSCLQVRLPLIHALFLDAIPLISNEHKLVACAGVSGLPHGDLRFTVLGHDSTCLSKLLNLELLLWVQHPVRCVL